MSKKKRKKEKQKAPTLQKRPNVFRNFSECAGCLKKSVYMVVRGRLAKKNEVEGIKWVTLGTGFVAAPNRFLSAGHVINNQESKDEFLHHKDGDKYYLLRHDDQGNWHFRIFEPRMGKEIFVYPEVDLAVIYLDEEFYRAGNRIHANKDVL